MIELKNISVTFQQKKQEIQAVQDVSLTIDKGDIYGIVGYSGAGKSIQRSRREKRRVS